MNTTGPTAQVPMQPASMTATWSVRPAFSTSATMASRTALQPEEMQPVE